MIHARGLARTFRTRRRSSDGGGVVQAVAGVDIDVEPGELVGFLGPNGAGKTTTLRMLTTLLTPTSGTATVAGHDLFTDPVGIRRRIGYVGQHGGAGPDVPIRRELEMQGRFYGLGAAQAHDRAGELLHDLDLTGMDERPAQALSGGQRRRLDIAMGLMHLPSLLFLDEPSTGLDPQSRANLWDHIRTLNAERGTTLFLTTHYLDEADVLCDRLLVIDRGRIVAQGTPDELKRRVSGDLVLLSVPDDAVGQALDGVRELPSATGVTADGGAVRFRVPDGGSSLPPLLRALDVRQVPMRAVEIRRPSLDDVFLSLTGRSLREGRQQALPDASPDASPGASAADERVGATGGDPR